MATRVRIAPSPTGFPHIGTFRTALFDYLLARHDGGAFILRIEDTDRARLVEGSVKYIAESLKWLGIEADEGVYMDADGKIAQRGAYGPYIQSERLGIYHEYAAKLLENGHGYRCFCTTERLDALRAEQQAAGKPPKYDRLCRALTKEEADAKVAAGESFVIRHAVPDAEEVVVTDAIRGEVRFNSADLDDYVLMKSDGFPTYQLASVVDDHLMEISHVLRGEEWLPSTPKNLLLYKAFGWTPPIFAHTPSILGPDGKHKLSKRDGADAALDYRDKGYMPEVLINFLAFLGWSPGTEQEIFTLDDLCEHFSLERVQKSPAVFDFNRLEYLSGVYIRALPVGAVAEGMLPFLRAAGLVLGEGQAMAPAGEIFLPQAFPQYLFSVAATVQERLRHFDESAELTGFFFRRPTVDPAIIVPKKSTPEDVRATLSELIPVLSDLPAEKWMTEDVEVLLRGFAEQTGRTSGAVLWPVRAAVTGAAASPGAFEMLAVLGKDESLIRLKSALG